MAGTILSFDGTTLVISRVDGTQLSGTVSADTEIEGCGSATTAAAAAARLSDDNEAEDSSEHGDRSSGDGQHTSGDGEHTGAKCTTAALVSGAAVHEAEVENGTFHSVHLSDD